MTRIISEALFDPVVCVYANDSENGDDRSLTWGVCSQPWVPGDKLMLRISQSEPDLTGATNDPSCPSPGP